MAPAAAEITALLGRVSDGDPHARDALLPLVDHELEAIARGYVHAPERSIEPRELVHELYVRLAATPFAARDRKHFYAIAAVRPIAWRSRSTTARSSSRPSARTRSTSSPARSAARRPIACRRAGRIPIGRP